jgi:lysophospholipase L1-like esterase
VEAIDVLGGAIRVAGVAELEQHNDIMLAFVETMPSGARLDLRTDADHIELDVDLTRVQIGDAPTARGPSSPRCTASSTPCASTSPPNLHLLEGTDLFGEDDLDDLPDGLHPNAAGYQRMGERFNALAFGPGGPFGPS